MRCAAVPQATPWPCCQISTFSWDFSNSGVKPALRGTPRLEGPVTVFRWIISYQRRLGRHRHGKTKLLTAFFKVYNLTMYSVYRLPDFCLQLFPLFVLLTNLLPHCGPASEEESSSEKIQLATWYLGKIVKTRCRQWMLQWNRNGNQSRTNHWQLGIIKYWNKTPENLSGNLNTSDFAKTREFFVNYLLKVSSWEYS